MGMERNSWNHQGFFCFVLFSFVLFFYNIKLRELHRCLEVEGGQGMRLGKLIRFLKSPTGLSGSTSKVRKHRKSLQEKVMRSGRGIEMFIFL